MTVVFLDMQETQIFFVSALIVGQLNLTRKDAALYRASIVNRFWFSAFVHGQQVVHRQFQTFGLSNLTRKRYAKYGSFGSGLLSCSTGTIWGKGIKTYIGYGFSIGCFPMDYGAYCTKCKSKIWKFKQSALQTKNAPRKGCWGYCSSLSSRLYL